MDEILKLTQEKSTWLFLADGLTQEHQQSVKLDILRKVDNLQSQINELKRAKADSSDELGDCNMPRVTRSYCVKKHMFFAVTNPVIESNLTKEDADKLCDKLNAEELDDTYVHYEVHNCV
jgi:hypothetical protein